MLITHTSFQLYCARFPQSYLQSIHDNGVVHGSDGVILSSTPLYNFCKPEERINWLDTFIALIEYLRSGKSKVGFLNNSVNKNMLHKGLEDVAEQELLQSNASQSTEDLKPGTIIVFHYN